ncbi:MAG: SMP-30/gluconolactonase/LRE family protein [Dongiaceae bacterium]
MKAECVVDIRSEVGETPIWDEAAGVLYWIDCLAPAVHRFRPRDDSDEIVPLLIDSGHVGAIALVEGGGFLVLAGSGLWLYPADGERRLLAKPDEDRPQNVVNDGKCDPQGRFWFGTMHNQSKEESGRLFRYDSKRGLVPMDEGFSCSNGMGWSPDGRTMYFVDMMPGRILAYDFDGKTGSILKRRVFAQVSKDEGIPDGLAVDNDGGVWVAHWDGWCLSHYAPDGKRIAKIDLPVQRPTCPAFGGADMRDLYVTSAAMDISADQLAKGPLAGSLFRLRADVAGPKAVRFKP